MAAAFHPVPKHWRAPSEWLGHPATSSAPATGALCIHSKEGAWNDATGNNYEGGAQFLASTWARAGGRVFDRAGRLLTYYPHTGTFNGVPWHWASLVSPREQLFRMWTIWLSDHRSWREWGTAAACGLR